MWAQVGEILPLAVGIAISPIPIIATLLMLMAPKARAASLGFAGGWIAGITVAVTVFTLLSSLLPSGDDRGQSTLVGVIKLLLGAGLLFLALRQWRSRPAPGEEPKLPGWMAAVDTMGVGKAAGLAFLLAGVNPKNLLLGAAAGVSIGQGESQVVPIVVFVLLAASSVVVPVLAYLVATERMTPPLQSLRAWLVQNNATVMAVLLLVLGTVVIGKALAAW